MKTSTLLQSSDFAERQLGLVLRAFGYVSDNQPTSDAYQKLIGVYKTLSKRMYLCGTARQRRRVRRMAMRFPGLSAAYPENISPSWTAGEYKNEQ